MNFLKIINMIIYDKNKKENENAVINISNKLTQGNYLFYAGGSYIYS